MILYYIAPKAINKEKVETVKKDTLKQPEQKETESSHKELIVSQYINDNTEIINKEKREDSSQLPA